MEFPDLSTQIEYWLQGARYGLGFFVFVFAIRIFKKLGSNSNSGMDQGL